MRHPGRYGLRAVGPAWLTAALAGTIAAGTVNLRVEENGVGRLLPCRVHLTDPEGKPVRPPGLPYWRDHFVGEGEVGLDLSPGRHRYEVERGPEWSVARGEFTVRESGSQTVTASLSRLTHLAREGWWCGDLHLHRPLNDIELLMRAEDLHIAPVITWWNNRNSWADSPLPERSVVASDANRFHHVLGGEDERGGGALLYFGLPHPLPLAGSAREFPSSMTFLRQAKARMAAGEAAPGIPVWAEIEKPFWWDVPVWLASGMADSAGIAHNHLQRGGVLDNEAWGRARDRKRYAGPQGNGRYTQDLYYHILNCGLRLPPSAGSASGVLPNPVGYNRAFVHVDGELTWAKWWEGLRAGRVFVSNGPLLRARANGQLPGHVFKSEGPLSVTLEARLDSREPIAAVELVRNGQIEKISLPTTVTFQESGWFLARAIADVPHTFRFASTGPWYVEIGEQTRTVQRDSAQFFLGWVRERARNVAAALTNEIERDLALATLREAEAFWEGKVGASAPRELIRDVNFRDGLLLLAPEAGGGEVGRVQLNDSTGTPVWQLAQWHSRFPLTNAALSQSDALLATNAAKWLALAGSLDEKPTLTLGVDSRPEYEAGLRRSPAEPWVHLLVQQNIADSPSLADLASLRLRFESRLTETETIRPEGYSALLHAAQFQVVLTLNNTQRGSPGFGDYLWFVVPVYDDRHEVPPEYVARDFAVTQGKLIYNPGGRAVGLKPMRPGEWQQVDCELRPWLERALRAAWAKGYLRDSRNLADYRVAHINVGWEVPGLNRVAMSLRGLSLRADLPEQRANFRPPTNETDLRDWLENMLVFHRFTLEEVSAATGLAPEEVDAAARRFELIGKTLPAAKPGDPLRVLPYPGGRHPRIGFLDGAVRPQRETKVSVFAPWPEGGYVVVDVPEAIFSNLGLIYLAHTHIPTLWDQQDITLPRLEWRRQPNGRLTCERTLPNNIAFGSEVNTGVDGVRFELWLRNGTAEKLTGLRVQNCVMLSGATGFRAQTLANKVFASPFAAARSDDGRHWVITTWERCGRAWGNDQVPCIHADPVFPDCPPGELVRVRGWLSFFEGEDIRAEFKRLDGIVWRQN